MGPLASAELLKTIYESVDGLTREQELPVVVLISDPTFPDRTTALRSGDRIIMLERLQDRLEELVALGCDRIVLCCMTAHAFLSELRPDLRARVVPLPKLLLSGVAAGEGPYLLLCSAGAREFKLYESDPHWPAASAHIRLPDERDQTRIHEMIYRIKLAACDDADATTVADLVRKYDARSFAAGCSEIHLVSKYMQQRQAACACRCIDPFALVAREIARPASVEALFHAGCL